MWRRSEKLASRIQRMISFSQLPYSAELSLRLHYPLCGAISGSIGFIGPLLGHKGFLMVASKNTAVLSSQRGAVDTLNRGK